MDSWTNTNTVNVTRRASQNSNVIYASVIAC